MRRPVKGFEGFYEVDECGNIYSLRTNKIRKPVLNKTTGYLTVVLCGRAKKTLTVHRIVANAFIPNPESYQCVNHKDENKTNNNVSNLEWCTKAYNNTYNNKTQRCCKKVVQILPSGKEVIWSSARKASEAGIANYKNISACCRGIRRTAGGSKWRFI